MKFEHQNVLIVIPTLNEEQNIVSCVLGLRAQAPRATIVITDGGSTDATVERALWLCDKFETVHVVNNPDRIQSAGINRAVAQFAAARHQILVRCDAHASYPPDFIDEILDSFHIRNCASVVVPMKATGSNSFSNGASWIVDRLLGNGGAKHRGSSLSGWVEHGHHAGMRLDWFERLGGYDPSFTHNEDAEYDHRLHALGGKVWMNGRIQIRYFMRPSLTALATQYFRYGAGRARTIRKHGLRPQLRQVLPTLNFLFLLIAIGISGWWTLGALYPIAYVTALVMVSIVAAFQMQNAAGLWAGVAIAAMHNSWALGFLYNKVSGDRR